MFNPFSPQPALAAMATPAPANSGFDLKSRVSLMLPGGVRGRVLGRGASPVSAPPAPVPPAPVPPVPAPEARSPQPSLPEPPAHSPGATGDTLQSIANVLGAMQSDMETLRADLSHLRGRGSDSGRVFDALHAELADYKRDFVFEHLKPMLRPMLFVFDALEEFDREMALHEDAQSEQSLAPDALRATKVRDNITFLREQFLQSLAMCDLEPLPVPEGRFDPHGQKAVGTLPVAAELDGHIQSVRRLGWTLKGHTLRPAEVIVGKAAPLESG